MIRNPYAKKRPRPSGWTSSSAPTSTPVEKPPSGTNGVTNKSFAVEPSNSRVCQRSEEACNFKENATYQTSDGVEKNRFSNGMKPSGHVTNWNPKKQSTEHTVARATRGMATAGTVTSYASKKIQHNLHTRNSTATSIQNDGGVSMNRTVTSTTNHQSRKQVYNPYARKKNSSSHLGAPAAKPPYLRESSHVTQVKENPNLNTTESIGLYAGSNAHATQVTNISVERNSNRPRIDNDGPQSNTRGPTGGTAMNKQLSSKTTTKLPSSMASIRPASWKSSSDHKGSNPSVDSSSSASTIAGQKSSIHHVKNIAIKSSTQPHFGKTEDETDRLPPELSYTPNEVKPIQDEYRMQLIKNANLSSPLKNGWTLFPHQKKAIIRALTMRRMILALDMGLGKTLIGTVWSKAFKDTFGHEKLKIFVICPVSLKEEWQRTAEDAGGLDVDGARKGKGKSKAKRKKSIETEETPKTNMKMQICSWAKVPKVVESSVEHFVVCCDEAHAMQSTQSQRTKDILSLVNDKRCVGVLLLTGTPMKNGKPGNLFPLLKAVRHPLGRHQKAFEAHFCNGMLKNFGRGPQWDASGASNLDQLKRKVASNLLHMTKEQCLKELPPMTSVHHDVPVSSRYQVQYEQSIKYLANVQANASNMRDEAVLGAVQRLRVVCAHAKVEATVELARSVLNKEPAVVIFTSFAQVAKNVHSKLKTSGWPCSLLTGETPQNKRQELVDKFQNGLSSVFVCTFGAGGVGLTLTAACTIILLDRPWTPGETRQAEDRIRRIGQVKKCTSYWMRSFDLDKQIDEMLESKKQTTNAVLDKNQKQKVTSGSSKISINQLVHKFVLSEARKKL